MPIGDHHVAGYVLKCKALSRKLEDLASEPGKRSHDLRETFTELAAVAAQGAAASFVEAMGDRR